MELTHSARTHVLTYSRTHVLTYSRTHVLTYSRTHVLTRELHTGLSPDKFALCSPRTGHPGQPVSAKQERKTNGRPFVWWPEIRPDKSGPCPALPARSPTEAQWPAPAEHPPVGRRRRQSVVTVAKIVAGRALKSSQAARQKGCRAPSRSPRPLTCPDRSRASRASRSLKKGKGVTDHHPPLAWKGMYSWVLLSGNQRSEGDGHPLLQCRRVRVQVVRWARGGRGHHHRSWPPPPT